MSKTWIAKCVSFKGKHPDGEVTHEVVVKAKYKKDAIEAAKKELEFWDAENHQHYKVPAVSEIENEEQASNELNVYLLTKEKAGQLEIAEQHQEEAELNADMVVRAILKNIEEEFFSDEMIEEAAEKLEDVLAEHENLDVQATLGNLAQHNWKVTFPMDTESEVRKMLLNIRRLRQDVISLLIKHDEKATSFEVEKAETALPPVAETEEELEEAEELTATIATVAEFPMVEPYAVRLSIAKNNESFVHSMTIVNNEKGACLVGQPDVFNPKPFSNIDNAVVYGLAMAIDAVNKYLVDFIDARQVEKCTDILSGYAQDAEGNFMERYAGDHDLSNAQFMAEPKKKETQPDFARASEVELTSDVKRIMSAVVTHQSFTRAFSGSAVEIMASMVERNFVELHKKHGMLPAAQIVEHIIGMTDAGKLQSMEECEEVVSHYVGRVYADESQEETDQEEIAVQYYAGQQWRHYVKEIMAQFEPPLLDEKEIDLAAQNVAHVFNDWKVALFAEKDNYTDDAEFFKDEVYLAFNNREHEKALELLKSYDRTQAALCEVLALAYDEFVENLPNQKVAEEIKNLVSRLLVDETMGCTYNCETIQALIYSELTANPVNDSTITNPTLKMQWWANLSADFAKQQAERMHLKAPISEQSAPESEQEPENAQQNTPDFEVEISPLNVSYHGDGEPYAFAVGGPDEMRAAAEELDQAMAERVEEITQKSEEYDQEACVHGDGVTAEEASEPTRTPAEALQGAASAMANLGKAIGTLPEEIAEPEITPDPIPSQDFYGEYLVNPDTSEEKDPFEELVATCLQTIDDAHLEIGKEEYAVAGQNVRAAFNQIAAAAGSKIDGEKTITNMQNIDWNSASDAINAFLDESKAFNVVAENAVIEPVSEENDPYIQKLQEAPTDEPETTRQDNEPLNDEPVAGPGDDAPVNADVEQPRHVTMRQLHKLQMRAANNHLGALGLGWGYEVKHHWSEGETKNCEVAIWFRDKNGTESKPMSFFGSANTTQTGDAINDAMTMALINGLDSILFSLGIEVEG